jgi:hypothetical protein
MVGIATVVYVREELAPLASKPECLRIRTGFGGSVGNKGAVCVKIGIGTFSACLVNVHLPSGVGKAVKRDRHLAKILSTTFRSRPAFGALPLCCDAEPAPGSEGIGRQHDFVALFGDFNSRLDPGASRSGGTSKNHDEWLQSDQMLKGSFESLGGFREGLVRFPPTFGYIPGSDAFGQKYRPAWCDRVAFKTARGAQAELLDYDAFRELMHTSDHRPIAAQFRVLC